MAKKSSATKIIIGVIIVVLFAAGAIWAKNYYEDRYVSSSYYTQVPMDEKVELQGLKNMDGKVVDKGYEYNLTAYDKDGKSKEVKVTVYAKKASELYQPGTYLKIEASKQVVTGQAVIQKDEIPAPALSKIEAK